MSSIKCYNVCEINKSDCVATYKKSRNNFKKFSGFLDLIRRKNYNNLCKHLFIFMVKSGRFTRKTKEK